MDLRREDLRLGRRVLIVETGLFEAKRSPAGGR
jgi:hypothetical protein